MIPIRPSIADIEPYVPGERVQGAVKLSSNENPLGTAPSARRAAVDALADASVYPNGAATSLRTALGEFHDLSEDRFIVGNGSDEVMILSAATYLEPGAASVMGAHTFSQYEFATRLFGGRPVVVDMADGRYPLRAIARAVDSDTRIVFLCNPNNPTGRYFTHDELAALLEAVPDTVLVVEDEAYREYVEAMDFPRSIQLQEEYPNLLVLRTFSKIYGMAGMRVGYGIGDSLLITDLMRAKQPFNVGSVSQAAASAALADVAFVERSLRLNREGKRFLYGEIEALGLPYHETEANFVCIDVGTDSRAVAEATAARGVTIRPLTSFGLPNMVRVTVGTREQNELFVACFRAALEEVRV